MNIQFLLKFVSVCLPIISSVDVFKYEGRSATILRWANKENSLAPKLMRTPSTIYDNR